MNSFMAYIPTGSVVHAVDARVKLLVLILFSIVALCVPSWIGVGACAAILFAVMLASRVPLRTYARTLLPAAAILVFIWICNSIPFEAERSMHALGYVVRISLVIVASFVITFTTTSTQLTDALASILQPLRALRVPVDDVAFTLSLALRFIPLVFEQLSRIKLAQVSRGAQFDTGSLWRRLKTWMVVLIPLFVGFFRQANTVAEAMDARCYGAARRTSLNDPGRTPKHKI
ncbi:energy-coupling factor transporter transmembrane component T family protein [Anaerotardibacter muris]|uniref:energy-coupling factor transporter transmembrane component T family protein n=1 Tax=Anaerotardibacter muris TaxID=2941505 RepID=UPI00203BE8CA|nr:energy-coupling factor transporter transmembrane component T [Anaerotardibacter muris]